MKQLRERLNKKGFTLAELLIVVAIIAVLVAVSIPVFNSKLEKSREATDIANMRAAKAAMVAALLNGDIADGTNEMYYDAEAGEVIDTPPANVYGQGTTLGGGMSFMDYKEDTDAKDRYIKIAITNAANAEFTMTWEK